MKNNNRKHFDEVIGNNSDIELTDTEKDSIRNTRIKNYKKRSFRDKLDDILIGLKFKQRKNEK